MPMPRTPSGETLEKLRRTAQAVEDNPKMRRAIAAVVKAMGLPLPPGAEKKGKQGG